MLVAIEPLLAERPSWVIVEPRDHTRHLLAVSHDRVAPPHSQEEDEANDQQRRQHQPDHQHHLSAHERVIGSSPEA
jgi:hypothetical protein